MDVTVKSGRGKYASVYKLTKVGIFKGKYHMAVRGEWERTLNTLFRDRESACSFVTYGYGGSGRTERVAQRTEKNGVTIGCHMFERADVRRIAKWCGWMPRKIKNFIN